MWLTYDVEYYNYLKNDSCLESQFDGDVFSLVWDASMVWQMQ